jgi:acyl-CoA reductase-like NAD-dependent aldehyde dehydrogenase
MQDTSVALLTAVLAIALASLVLFRRRAVLVDFEWSCPPEATGGWRGELLDAPSIHAIPGKITAYDPATGYRLATYDAASPASVTAHIDKAVAAATAWSRTTFEQRRAVMRSLLAFCLRETDALSRVACRDSGKTSAYSPCRRVMLHLTLVQWSMQPLARSS